MVTRVAERVTAARNIGRVIVATDDDRIRESVEQSGFEAVMTRTDHASGTDRLAEVVANIPEAEIVVNVQGDEPLIASATIERAVDALNADEAAGIATTWEPINDPADVLNPSVVKIVMSENGEALYFSRSPVPFPQDAASKYDSATNHDWLETALEDNPELLRRFKKHTGLYVYRREVLLEFTKWPQSELERSEGLEQLRALEHGVKIIGVEAAERSIAVDTAEDLERVRAICRG